MRIPSRYMPKYKVAPVGVKGWYFLAVILGIVLYFIWLAPYLLLLVPVYVAIDIYDKKKRNKHFKRLLQDRDDDSICTFSRYFEYRKIDTWIIRAVYEQLQTYMSNEKEKFPIRPTDDVFIDLMVDDEDFEYDLVEEIAQRTGRSLENAESNPFYGKANIVENLVYFFNEQPKANET